LACDILFGKASAYTCPGVREGTSYKAGLRNGRLWEIINWDVITLEPQQQGGLDLTEVRFIVEKKKKRERKDWRDGVLLLQKGIKVFYG